MNTTAAAAAAAAVVLAAASNAKEPAQLVVAVAAGSAFVALLTRARQATPSDWLTVRLLLAGNLIVFGVGNRHELGTALAMIVVVNGILLTAAAIRAHVRRRPRAGR